MKFLACCIFLLALDYSIVAQQRYLLVTSGGGVAGTATQYNISLDGNVLRGKGLGEIKYTESAKLKKRMAKKYFRKTEAMLAAHPDFRHPGNLYYSITMDNQGKEIQITWGDNEYKVPADVEKLYKKIDKALTRLTFVPDMRK